MEGAFFSLTTNDAVRAQIGTDSTEFSDDFIESLGLADELKLDLLEWFPAFQSLSDDDSTDTAIVKQQLALKGYAKAFCASTSMPALRMRLQQKTIDGDNQAVRFQNENSMTHLANDLAGKAADYKAKVLAIDTPYTPTVAEQTITVLGMAVSSPDTDAVVG